MTPLPASARARAWCRVDLAGGTLDIWPLGLLHPSGRTVNLAINLPARARLVRRTDGYVVEQDDSRLEAATLAEFRGHPEGALAGEVLAELETGPVSVTLESRSPRGGGLGASSALVIALIAAAEALQAGPQRSAPARAALARDLEARLMLLPTGIQDHYPALLGGVLDIAYRPGGEVVRSLAVDLEALGDSLLVAYTGSSHFSAGANWSVVRRRLDGEAQTRELFERIAVAANEVLYALEAGDLPAVGAAMAREWAARRLLSEEVSTPRIEELLATAAELGAWGGKACGAGGGGCVAILAPPARRSAIAAQLTAMGAEVLPVRPAAGGVVVETS